MSNSTRQQKVDFWRKYIEKSRYWQIGAGHEEEEKKTLDTRYRYREKIT